MNAKIRQPRVPLPYPTISKVGEPSKAISPFVCMDVGLVLHAYTRDHLGTLDHTNPHHSFPVSLQPKRLTHNSGMSNMKYFTSNDGYQLAYQDVGDLSLRPLIIVRCIVFISTSAPSSLATSRSDPPSALTNPSSMASQARHNTGNTTSRFCLPPTAS
jgi:hypothetical protein